MPRDETEKSEHRPQAGRSRSMHDNVPIWDDEPCCCEPEPRWQAVRDEMDEAERGRREQSSHEEHDGG